MLDKIGLKEQILKCEDLPQPQSNRGHKVTVILEAFITSIWCSNRFMHTEVTRHDVALGKIPTNGFFNKFNQTINQKKSDYLGLVNMSWLFLKSTSLINPILF